MTDYLKKLLHDFGLLYVTLHGLEEKHSKGMKISLKDYDDSLGEILPGEPTIIVKISTDGKSEFIDKKTNEKNDSENISILELPEDEFYFFEAFRLGIFNLEQEIPSFIYNMWIIHSYSLFENYLKQILKSRFFINPKIIGGNKSLTFNDLLESDSKGDLMDKFIDLELRDLLYLPINGLLEKMRTKLGFKKLIIDFDSEIRKISLVRNCLVHNGGLVNDKLANEYSSEFELNEKMYLTNNFPKKTIRTIRKLAYEIDKVFETINKYAP